MDGESLRIIHCFRSPVGGIFRHVRDLVYEHSRAGHQVGILCDSTTGGSFEDKLFEEIQGDLALGVTRLPIGRSVGPSDLAALWSAYKQIKSLQPDVLHGHGAKGGALARVIGSALRANKYRVARLYSPHGGSMHFVGKGIKGAVVFTLERLLKRFGDAMVFVCAYERDVFIRQIGKPARMRVVYNGLKPEEFEPVTPASDRRDFLFIGMLRDLKGPDLFINAFAEAERKAGRPLSALMIGDGPDEAKYRDFAVNQGYGRRIPIFPSQRQRDAFEKVRTVVLSSRGDTLPYIVLEAIAAGLPVIAFGVGGVPEILGRGNPGLVPPGDVDRLAEVMAESVHNHDDWAKRMMPDPEFFRQKFSREHMASDIMAIYREILADQA
ncbi:glycosyltransferase [Rhizobium sp. L1K21]|uniref:glycosyltransferase n=1 Tax=Rhizobium sp. L1K21 TaxID=2954933 RepID=UPI002091E5BF|nr:glycosyltransferase [Rhizobium sp. L1K21]MCO6185840.1 glycosyltransferase [Rhizobium sp. L1K21]